MQSDLLVTVQVAVIIMSAKFPGRFVDGKLKQPAVIGEVMAGLIIGPFALDGIALGSLVLNLPLAGRVVLPSIGPLFPMDSTPELRIPLPARDLAVLTAENLLETFRAEGFHVFDLPIRRKSWDLRRDTKVIPSPSTAATSIS
ncbi:MAG: hypothetical protein JXR55_04895 [Candidatus Fermentibacteraceae bacterium]|nr:hypothetical protein [Candidatus Fermentibacteraceae bacterium]